jgi:hypothetical protein
MTHLQVLIRALARHGRVTYADLVERNKARGYTYRGFVQAVRDAQFKGVARPPISQGHPIEITGPCPMCGRSLRKKGE